MTLWDMIAMVVLVAVAGGIVSQYLHSREKIALAKRENEGSADLAAKQAALEERVRVLERIATDKSVRLKDEIDAL